MQIIILGSVETFLDTLQKREIAKVIHSIELLEEFGNSLGLPHSRHMSAGLLELRIRGTREIRILYCFNKKKAVLLHAFIKKTEKTPERELRNALSKMKDLQ